MASTSNFSLAQIEALAEALVSTEHGLSHHEVGTLLANCSLVSDRLGSESRTSRLIRAFTANQNHLQSNVMILKFVRLAAEPARFINRQQAYEDFRERLNIVLTFVGYSVGEDGKLSSGTPATTLPAAQRRANELRTDLQARNVHPDVMRFCREELLTENYFHAVLEATKSLSAKIRQITCLEDDGALLVDQAFGSSEPSWIINPYQALSERKEQAGFCNLLKGIFGMFRNPTAHEARIHWFMEREDAADLLSILSLAHRRIDKATMRKRS
jgi:uncharacterized protein (TIGR02391 family)